MATMETRGEKIEEFHKHLKYREHILEFAGPKMNVTEEAAADESPKYSNDPMRTSRGEDLNEDLSLCYF